MLLGVGCWVLGVGCWVLGVADFLSYSSFHSFEYRSFRKMVN